MRQDDYQKCETSASIRFASMHIEGRLIEFGITLDRFIRKGQLRNLKLLIRNQPATYFITEDLKCSC